MGPCAGLPRALDGTGVTGRLSTICLEWSKCRMALLAPDGGPISKRYVSLGQGAQSAGGSRCLAGEG